MLAVRAAPERGRAGTATHAGGLHGTDYMSPEAFSAKLIECTKSDWQLDDKWLLSLFPSLANVAGSALGAAVKVEFVKAELQKDPRTALQTIIEAYSKLVKDAKRNRKNGDPWVCASSREVSHAGFPPQTANGTGL